MKTKGEMLISFFRTHGGVARFSAILKADFHPDTLSLLEKRGELEKIARGLYRLTSDIPRSHPDLVLASLQAPGGVVCLLSSLAFHEVTSEVPRYVEMAILRGSHANKIKYPPVRFYRFSSAAWRTGITAYDIDGHRVRVYSLAKTIADCFKFRNKIGLPTVREALKAAITEKKAAPQEIMHYAKICRVDRLVKPILEAML